MSAMKRFIGGCVFVCSLLATTVLAQEVQPAQTEHSLESVTAVAPLVTATATATRVRFVAPGSVVQLRLEVFNESGQKVFDTELRGGNVLDWQLQDGAGDRLPPGAYASVLTIKSLSGRLSQRMGLVMVTDEKASIEADGRAQLSPAQEQTIGPLEGNAAFTILQNSEAQAITTVTHDGTEGQVARTRGALSFRVGDLFSGKDSEQMRLTEAGNLGIGTDKPQARLDVAGTIRTSEGIEFANRATGADGTKVTKLTTTATGGLQQTLADGTVVPNATGTGTQNNIAKWTDNAGALGDSSMFETNGRVGLGTTTPGAKFHVVGSQGSISAGTFQLDTSIPFSSFTGAYPAFELLNTNPTNNNVSLFQFSDAPSGAAHAGIGAVATNHATKFGDLFFFTKQADGYQARMGIFGGNVGIGTTAPGAKLDVAGNINTSTQYNIGGNHILSNPGDSNLFAGVGAGQANSRGFWNSFYGKDAGLSNNDGSSNAFFGFGSGLSNTFGVQNSFFGTFAGGANSGGDGNSSFGKDSGGNNNSGRFNSFFGWKSGLSNTGESNNTFIGASSNGAAGITNSTAVGANAQVSQSNSLVLGSGANVGIGTTGPTFILHVVDSSNTGLRVQTNTSGGTVASFGGNGDFQIDAPGAPGGRFAVTQGGNVGIGISTGTPGAKLQVAGGDIAVTTQLKGLILRAFDGPACYRLTVNQAGVLGSTFVACP